MHGMIALVMHRPTEALPEGTVAFQVHLIKLNYSSLMLQLSPLALMLLHHHTTLKTKPNHAKYNMSFVFQGFFPPSMSHIPAP